MGNTKKTLRTIIGKPCFLCLLVIFLLLSPYIILKWAQTQDHFIAKTDFNSKWISNSLSRQLVHKWRSEEKGILIGYNTAKHDNPKLSTRNWQGPSPTRVVIDPKNELNETLHLFDGTQATIIFTKSPKKNRKNLKNI